MADRQSEDRRRLEHKGSGQSASMRAVTSSSRLPSPWR
jgi:hypothetical protein